MSPSVPSSPHGAESDVERVLEDVDSMPPYKDDLPIVLRNLGDILDIPSTNMFLILG